MGKNTIKQQGLSEEVQEELQEAAEEKAEETQKFLRTLPTAGNLSIYSIVNYLPFIGFVTLLMLLYITNRHFADRTIRNIDKSGKDVKE